MTGVSIELSGLNEAFTELDRLADGLTFARDMWNNVGAAIQLEVEQRFERGEGPGGQKWPASLRAIVQQGQTLVNMGLLRDSLTRNLSNRIVTDHSVEVGTNLAYAAIHQFGGTIHHKERRQKLQFRTHQRTGKTLRGFRNASQSNFMMMADVAAHDTEMPARPFLGIDSQTEDRIVGVIEDWIASLVTVVK